ncbi:BAG domain-containing protein [Colletotrichum melonis]|uniref:BAG domain-containing protein n=1 Tax=Colletotrichum melonis TaxID=1209925 RepID=A0AAI9V969_9PEZI|nr:BAG domain-containing protein [Colletotrichum melonis]
MGNELTSAPESKWRYQRQACASTPDRILGHPYSAAHVSRFMMTARYGVHGSESMITKVAKEPPLHIHFHASPSRNLTQHHHFRPLTSRRRPQLSAVILSESRRATFDTQPLLKQATLAHSLTRSLTQNRTLRRIPARRPHHRLFAHPPPTRTPKADSALPSFQSCFYSLTKANEPPPGSLTQAGDRPRQLEPDRNSRRPKQPSTRIEQKRTARLLLSLFYFPLPHCFCSLLLSWCCCIVSTPFPSKDLTRACAVLAPYCTTCLAAERPDLRTPRAGKFQTRASPRHPTPTINISLTSATIPITAAAFDLASLHLFSPPPPPPPSHPLFSLSRFSVLSFKDRLLPPRWLPVSLFWHLLVYLDKSIASLAKAIANYSGYISDTTGIDPNLILYSTIGCILLAVPFTMSRYGWSTNREQISPYGSTLSGVPDVTDEDFSYITTEDLQSTSLGSSVPTRSYAHNPRSRGSVPDDDILLIKNKGITYPAHFPAYAIGDGKLRVRDVRDRVSVLLELSERRGRRVKLLYKGRQLKEPAAPVRDYGVKNNSEVMVVLPEGEVDAESSDDSDEEMVVVGGDGGSAVGSNGGTDDGKKRRGKKKGRKSKKRSSNTSPRDSASNLGVPGQERQSSPSPSKANGPHAKLDAIAAKFEADLRQPCEDYIASPPTDPKKREEEHRKLSETTMQHVLLKLDEVETEGDQDARMKRKALVQTVQDVLKRLDARLKA